jgi:hypothetical protein
VAREEEKTPFSFKDIKINIDQKSFSCQLFTKLKLEMPRCQHLDEKKNTAANK